MDKHEQLGEKLGYEGKKLRDFVKRQQGINREERAAERENEQNIREVDKMKEGI